ncbi:MAG: hypothetical protein ACTHN3_01300 [Solirubrobacterales bacterium]
MVDWQALDMEVERSRSKFERRLEEGRVEIVEHMERVLRCCREAEEARKRDWEELKGRLMTAEEQRRLELDSIQMLFATMTHEHVRVIAAAMKDMEHRFAETRGENQAHTEALLKLLDRLPPD